ncbi:MAG: hypothetical protein GX142_01615 [Chloroflexi bacterium]|nr:hypothetical protein [Chloroflexota bacterium]
MTTKMHNNGHPTGSQPGQQKENKDTHCKTYALRFRTDMICPRCQSEKLDYNSMLQRVCPRCGIVETGAFT